MQIHPSDQRDLDALRGKGWRVTDPKTAAGSPQQFRHFVQSSGAEFSVAQGIYVDTNSGWFSDRTVRYLASGRPALVQETGFTRLYPTGEGLLSFRSLDEAVDGAERIARDYGKHWPLPTCSGSTLRFRQSDSRNCTHNWVVTSMKHFFHAWGFLVATLAVTGQPGELRLPPIAQDVPFSFVVLGDNRGDESGQQPPAFTEVLTAVQREAPSLILDSGDMIYGHTRDAEELETQWRIYRQTVSGVQAPIFHVPGNHDLWSAKSAKSPQALGPGPLYIQLR